MSDTIEATPAGTPPEPEPDTPPTTPEVPDGPTDRLFPVRGWRMALEAVLAAGIPWVWAVFNYRLWDISPRVPINAHDDARLITNLVKNTADQGWWTTNPDLGYPVGQQLYDFPHGGETWQLVIIRIISVFTKSPGLIMNTYFFVGIGVAALAAYLALRHLRFGVGVSLVASTALTWLPFRLGHSQWHLFRTSFWWVPLAIVVVLWVIHWRERFLKDPDPAPREGWRATLTWTVRHNLRVRRVVLFGLMVLVLGMSETMTTAFTLTLLALTGLLGALRRREPATLLVHGLAIAAIGFVFFVGMASSLRFFATHGTNPDAGRRVVVEQELYGLKLSDMLLPDPSHRDLLGIGLGDWSREIRDATRIPSEGGQSIGLLGAAGFVGAVIHALTHGWGRPRRDLRPLHDRASLRDDVSLIATLGFLVATISGGAIFLSLMGFSQVRVWNRMSLLIGFCSLIFALTWLEAGWTRLRERVPSPSGGRPWPRVLAGVAAVGVLLAFVMWDGSHVQFRPPGGKFGLSYEKNDEEWRADADYAARIDEAMPDGSAVFQFPIIRFPEAPPPGQMKDYDHLRAWVHLPPDKLKWSYGAMKGRPDGDWQLAIRERIGEEGSLPLLVGLGFDGIWVDTWGYDDYGLRVRTAFDDMLGDDPILSADQRIRFYDLTEYKQDLLDEGKTMEGLRAEALRQLGVEAGD